MRRVVGKLGLLLAGTALALLAAEVVVRLAAPYARDHVMPSGTFDMDDALGWRLASERTGRHRTRYFDVVYRTNRAGFRDRQRVADQAAETWRMLVYGDSQVFGWGVEVADRFTNRLEEQSAGAQVWNLAVPGYGLDQQIISYASLADDIAVDQVVFYVSRASLSRSTTGKIYRKFKPRFELAPEGLRQVPIPAGANRGDNLLYRVVSPFYLPYLLERGRATLRQRDAGGSGAQSAADQLTALDEALVRHAIGLARDRGHEPLVLDALSEAYGDELWRLCSSEGVVVLQTDISRLAEARFGPHDSHWTAAAHDLVARQILTQLEAAGLEVD